MKTLFIILLLSLFIPQAFSSDASQEVAKAIEFWENKKPSAMRTEKMAYWNEIADALNGSVSDSLMDRVTKSWEGARVGGKFYNTWKSVYERFLAIKLQDALQDSQQQEPAKPIVVVVIPETTEGDVPPDAIPQNSEPTEIARPAWFNPGGGYGKNISNDGFYDTMPAIIVTCTIDFTNAGSYGCSKEGEQITWTSARTYTEQDDMKDNGYLGWGPWDDLPEDTKQAITAISVPSDESAKTKLGYNTVSSAGNISAGHTGTATYRGNAEGVFRPDLFGVVYGNKDNPNTGLNEYDDGGPRIELTVNFDKNYLNGKLSARRPANDISGHPPSLRIQAPRYINEYNDASDKANFDNFGDYADAHDDLDNKMRSVVVYWNGIKLDIIDRNGNRANHFEGQGLYGEFVNTCKTNCGTDHDAVGGVRGIINHPRFVGSYIAPKPRKE